MSPQSLITCRHDGWSPSVTKAVLWSTGEGVLQSYLSTERVAQFVMYLQCSSAATFPHDLLLSHTDGYDSSRSPPPPPYKPSSLTQRLPLRKGTGLLVAPVAAPPAMTPAQVPDDSWLWADMSDRRFDEGTRRGRPGYGGTWNRFEPSATRPACHADCESQAQGGLDVGEPHGRGTAG